LDKTKLETVAAVKKAFYTLLLAEDLLSLNKQILKNTQDHLDSLNARFKKGEVSRSDILQLSASLSNVKRAYQESAHQREAAEALLHKLLYLGEDVTLVPEGILGYHKREVAFDAAFLKAMQNRPEIRQYNAQAKADESAIELARADNRPDIYASWDYYSKSHLATTGGLSRSRNDYNIMGITISWPLFDGWATRAKVEQALVDLKETQLTKEKAIKDITLELKNAYLSLKNAISKIEASNADLALYRDNLRSSLEKYREGILSSLDKDDARLKYTVAKFNKEQAIYDYLIAKNSFEQATGGYS
jgi:outer membrane protein TolC